MDRSNGANISHDRLKITRKQYFIKVEWHLWHKGYASKARVAWASAFYQRTL